MCIANFALDTFDVAYTVSISLLFIKKIRVSTPILITSYLNSVLGDIGQVTCGSNTTFIDTTETTEITLESIEIISYFILKLPYYC